MISEDLPFWVLGMKSIDWESFNCLKYETESRPEVQAALDRLSSKRRILLNQNFLIGQSHLTDIALIGGSPQFLLAVLPLLPEALPLVIHCERRSRRDPLPDKLGITWTRISHARMGGVTNQHIWVGIRNIEDWALAPRVTRRIGHIIAHSERPKPCQKDSTFPHYTPRDTLERGKLTLPVMYPSNFSYTGFGQRLLTGEELCSAFDITNWMKSAPAVLQTWLDADAFSSTMLPLQLFSAVLDETVPLIAPALEIIKSIPTSKDVDDASSYGIQLIGINKFLVHSWIDPGLISEKAVKSDDAGVSTGMWDKRISLVLSVAVDAMNQIRTMILHRWRRRNTRSLISFLENVQHGGDWREKIALLRQASKSRLEAARSAALLGFKKRKRGGW
jgi:hypothetical protein